MFYKDKIAKEKCTQNIITKKHWVTSAFYFIFSCNKT